MPRIQSGPNPVDIHVGLRVRARRKAVGITQHGLASAIGLTFQQVQKYEMGSNRISASKLFEIAAALHVELSHFFDGYIGPIPVSGAGDMSSDGTENFYIATEGAELAREFPKIKSRKVRRAVLELIHALSHA